MTPLAIIIIVAATFAAGILGFVTATIMAAGARADACHDCPDRRAVDALMVWRDGTE